MNFFTVVKPLGILTYIFLLLAIISGLFGWKMKNHKILAITAITLATFHALIVAFTVGLL